MKQQFKKFRNLLKGKSVLFSVQALKFHSKRQFHVMLKGMTKNHILTDNYRENKLYGLLVPILIPTYGGIENKRICIQAGADVVLLYPYKNAEIKLYTLSLIRRYTQWKEDNSSEGSCVSFGSLTIDYLARNVYWKQSKLNLMNHEFDFIKLISSMTGRLSRLDLLSPIELEEPGLNNVQRLLDAIEDEQLLHIMLDAEKMTLQILLLKMNGYSVCEIAERLEITERAIYCRIDRLKKKIKKILPCARKKGRSHRLLSVGKNSPFCSMTIKY